MGDERGGTGHVRLRDATRDDIPMLVAWDHEPHVIASDPDSVDRSEADWAEEFDIIDRYGHDVQQFLIAEVDSTPVGVMQIIDPAREPTGYWHPIEEGLRALDIWLGPPEALGRGYGTQMMTQTLEACFANPGVDAVIIDPLAANLDAIRFYTRIGFAPEGERWFNNSHCLVMRITRDAWDARA